jgi:hypothetical protein
MAAKCALGLAVESGERSLEEVMKAVFILMLLTLSAFAQQEAPVAAACGPKDVKFEAKLDDSQHTLAQPEAGKTLVYFIQDIGAVNCIGGCMTTRIGLDGAWVGANQHNSYFSMSVEPGEHSCVRQPAIAPVAESVREIRGDIAGAHALHCGGGEGLLLPHAEFR